MSGKQHRRTWEGSRAGGWVKEVRGTSKMQVARQAGVRTHHASQTLLRNSLFPKSNASFLCSARVILGNSSSLLREYSTPKTGYLPRWESCWDKLDMPRIVAGGDNEFKFRKHVAFCQFGHVALWPSDCGCFETWQGTALHRASPISRCPPSKVNPPMSDWIVWRVIEPDSSLLHKGKDKLPISPRHGGSQDGVYLSGLLTTYKSLPQSSTQALGRREKEVTGLG